MIIRRLPILLIAALFAGLLGLWLVRREPAQPTSPESPVEQPTPEAASESALTASAPLPQELSVQPATESTPAAVEQWLNTRNRTAAALLAAFRASGDTNYLCAAAREFPNDPHVHLAVLSRDAFPAERREWLDRFKASTPTNSLANYLSAEDHFKNGRTNDAITDLIAAAAKPHLGGLRIEAFMDVENLHQFSGGNGMESAALALSKLSEEVLPQMANLKRLNESMAEVGGALRSAGDVDSAQNLALMGMILSEHLRQSEVGKLIIARMVADALAARALAGLEQSRPYDFLNGSTPAQVVQEIREKRAAARALIRQGTELLPTLSETEFKAYRDRMLLYSEEQAARWLIDQKGGAER